MTGLYNSLSLLIFVGCVFSVVLSFRSHRPKWEWKLDLTILVSLFLHGTLAALRGRWWVFGLNVVGAALWAVNVNQGLARERKRQDRERARHL